jgi:hypothetical protein
MYLRYTGRPEGRLAIVGWLVGFSLWLIEQTEGQKQRTMFPLARANYSEPPDLKNRTSKPNYCDTFAESLKYRRLENAPWRGPRFARRCRMESTSACWAQPFGLTLCPATALDAAIPASALGVAVIFQTNSTGEKIFLVLESRATPLAQHCHKRLQTATLPPVATLTVAFKITPVAGDARAALDAVCRQQMILSGELRRALRPALR